MKRLPLEGRLIGNWEILSYIGSFNKKSFYQCRCKKCGQIKPVRADKLVAGRSKQCAECRQGERLPLIIVRDGEEDT